MANLIRLQAILDLLWPRTCWICDQVIQTHTSKHSLCDTCQHALLRDNHNTCPRCASTVGPHTDTTHGCPRCRSQRFAFRSAIRLGLYEDHVRETVLRMKNSAYEPLSDVVGELWATHRRSQFDEHTIDIVIPMPLHWSRRWSRGYNQSDNLARAVAHVIGKPCVRNALVRRKATVSQKGLSAAERWRNMTGAFRPGRTMVKNMRVLLIDDVMTTGATADAAARTLLQAGAAQVRLAIVAHG